MEFNPSHNVELKQSHCARCTFYDDVLKTLLTKDLQPENPKLMFNVRKPAQMCDAKASNFNETSVCSNWIRRIRPELRNLWCRSMNISFCAWKDLRSFSRDQRRIV